MPKKKANKKAPGQTSLFSSSEKIKRAAKAKPLLPVPKPLPRLPGKKIWLSTTSLEARRRCPRCFWLRVNMKIYQPEGIVSRLANRFDVVIKKYFDLYRGTPDLPPMVTGQIRGRLQSPFQEAYFVTIDHKYGYMGKLDECLIDPDGKFVPVDFKTASSDPNTKELIPAYQWQLDSYAFILERNRKPTSGTGHLIYFYPGHGEGLHQGFPMEVTVKTLKTDPSRLPTEIQAAIDVLEGKLPPSSPDCNFCTYVETIKEF